MDPVKCLVVVAKALTKPLFDAIMSCEENIQSLKFQMGELNSKKSKIERRIEDAEKEGKDQVNTIVNDWLQKIEKLESEANELFSRYEKLCRCFDYLSPFVWQQYNTSKEAKALSGCAKDLYDLGNFDEVASKPLFTDPIDVTVVGRDRTLEQLEQYMEDDGVQVIALYGMGRIGKTSVLKKFCHDFKNGKFKKMGWIGLEGVPENQSIPRDESSSKGMSCNVQTFPNIIWIDLERGKESNVQETGKESNVQETSKVQTTLMQKLDLNFPEKDRADSLYNHLKNKRYLLILDNVWKPLDLKGIGIPLGKGEGVKVILTTRSLNVCTRMDAKEVKVKGLEFQDAYRLFLEKAKETASGLINNNSTIEEIAKTLVSKCDGLPEAIITVGYAVANKENIEQWEHVLYLLTNEPWKVPEMSHLLGQLKKSYDDLDCKLRTCLLYCSLYPEGFSIDKQWIIDYCIGEGQIDIATEGDIQLGELKVASLLETGDDEKHIRMHPVVRAMALWVAENKWLVQADVQLKEAPKAHLWTGAQKISLMRNDIQGLLEVPDCPNLETLLHQRNRNLARIHDDFFQSMPHLRVLDISYTKIELLPRVIGKLLNLQYLDLCNTKIGSLPEELGALVNLKFLLLEAMSELRVIPSGVLEKLCELQVLKMYNRLTAIVNGKWALLGQE